MELPLNITFRQVDGSPELEALIHAEAKKLERYFTPLVSCRVMVERPQRAGTGAFSHVRIDLVVPKAELVVDHDAGMHGTLRQLGVEKPLAEAGAARLHKQAARAVREAFREMRRRLQDHARKLRGNIKSRAETGVHGRVTRLLPAAEHGFLETFDGREIYFHRNSVSEGRFDQLRAGSEVTFVEVRGEEGPQASTVHLLSPRKQVREAAGSVVLAARPPRRMAAKHAH